MAYRGFWDIPRLLLTQDAAGFWILDCRFDPERDEYPSVFKLYYAGFDTASAMSIYENHNAEIVAGYRGEIAFAALEFDPSRRKQVRIEVGPRSSPAVSSPAAA